MTETPKTPELEPIAPAESQPTLSAKEEWLKEIVERLSATLEKIDGIIEEKKHTDERFGVENPKATVIFAERYADIQEGIDTLEVSTGIVDYQNVPEGENEGNLMMQISRLTHIFHESQGREGYEEVYDEMKRFLDKENEM